MTWGDYLSYKARAEAAEDRVVELEECIKELEDERDEQYVLRKRLVRAIQETFPEALVPANEERNG